MKNIKKGFEKLGDIVDLFLADTGYKTICNQYDVVRKWKEIVGDRFFEVTKCDRIENNILYVKVSTAPWRQEAVYLKDKILENARRETGCITIKDIIFF